MLKMVTRVGSCRSKKREAAAFDREAVLWVHVPRVACLGGTCICVEL
jgi:hypothetical protein